MDAPQRRFTRISLGRTARLDFQETSHYHRRIKDLSLGGMYILGRTAMGKGNRCHVLVRQSGAGADLSIQANARVVREDADGMAMEFTSMTYESYMLLQMLLLHEAEDPMTVSRECAGNRPFRLLDTASA